MLEDFDFEAASRSIALLDKARKAVETRRYTDRPGDGWNLTDCASLPQRVGVHNKVMISTTDDGEKYEVLVFTYAGKQLHSASYKTLDAAFRNGVKFAGQKFDEPKKDEPAPVVEEAPADAVEEAPAAKPTKARRGDLVMVELRSSYTTTSYAREEVMEYKLMTVTNLTREGAIKMVRDDRYGYEGSPQNFEDMLYRTGSFWLLPAASFDVAKAQEIAGSHVYPQSTTPRCFPSLDEAREALAPARLDYVAPVQEERVEEPAAELATTGSTRAVIVAGTVAATAIVAMATARPSEAPGWTPVVPMSPATVTADPRPSGTHEDRAGTRAPLSATLATQSVRPSTSSPSPKPSFLADVKISVYKDCSGNAQACIDAGTLTFYAGKILAGHNHLGYQWLSRLKEGTTIRVTTGPLVGTYRVYSHLRIDRQGGAIPSFGSADLVLQTCEGGSTGFSLLHRI